MIGGESAVGSVGASSRSGSSSASTPSSRNRSTVAAVNDLVIDTMRNTVRLDGRRRPGSSEPLAAPVISSRPSSTTPQTRSGIVDSGDVLDQRLERRTDLLAVGRRRRAHVCRSRTASASRPRD